MGPTNQLRWYRHLSGLLALILAICGAETSATRSAPPVERPGVARVESTAAAQPVTAEEVAPHIEYLAGPELLGRGGRQRRLAAEYLREQFRAIGLQPLFDDASYFQEIPKSAHIVGPASPDAPPVGINVGGFVPGSDPELRDEYVIISAHYDHLGIRGGEVHPGADDNASGVAMMLETAREVAALAEKPRRSIVFVGFDLEEELLWGSRWFAAHPPWELDRVKLFITADMIGRSLGDLDLPLVFVLGSERAPLLREVLDDVPLPEGFEIARLGIDLIGTRSDYGPFRDREIPFLFFSTGQHADYHTPGDVIERVNFERVAKVSNIILSAALIVAHADETPQWTNSGAPDLDEARAVHRITELVLEADQSGERPINSLQRFFVSQVHAKTGNAIRLGRITPTESRWLARSSQLLLLSVF